MSASTLDPIRPDKDDIPIAGEALDHVQHYLEQHPREPEQVHLIVAEDGEELVVPRGAVELLARILSHMASGHGVSVVPEHAELTTQQAADLLNVSRPYLISLLEAGKIDHRKVGSHRRVKGSSLLDYKRRDDASQREAADELSVLNQEMGLT